MSMSKLLIFGANVAAAPCSDDNILTVLNIFGYIILFAKVVVPLLIIAYGTFDYYKAVIDNDEKSLSKQTKQFLMRILTGFLVFIIPTFIDIFFDLSDRFNIIDNDNYRNCRICLLEPRNCP